MATHRDDEQGWRESGLEAARGLVVALVFAGAIWAVIALAIYLASVLP
ncbi:MAG: hypothetical protein KJ007_03000 [Burkholderiales bacterium]|nr:hypothetical protein [Burkholderiales bacterium]